MNKRIKSQRGLSTTSTTGWLLHSFGLLPQSGKWLLYWLFWLHMNVLCMHTTHIHTRTCAYTPNTHSFFILLISASNLRGPLLLLWHFLDSALRLCIARMAGWPLGYFELRQASQRNTRNHSNYKSSVVLWMVMVTIPLIWDGTGRGGTPLDNIRQGSIWRWFWVFNMVALEWSSFVRKPQFKKSLWANGENRDWLQLCCREK